jgi:hypothetical protein
LAAPRAFAFLYLCADATFCASETHVVGLGAPVGGNGGVVMSSRTVPDLSSGMWDVVVVVAL